MLYTHADGYAPKSTIQARPRTYEGRTRGTEKISRASHARRGVQRARTIPIGDPRASANIVAPTPSASVFAISERCRSPATPATAADNEPDPALPNSIHTIGETQHSANTVHAAASVNVRSGSWRKAPYKPRIV